MVHLLIRTRDLPFPNASNFYTVLSQNLLQSLILSSFHALLFCFEKPILHISHKCSPFFFLLVSFVVFRAGAWTVTVGCDFFYWFSLMRNWNTVMFSTMITWYIECDHRDYMLYEKLDLKFSLCGFLLLTIPLLVLIWTKNGLRQWWDKQYHQLLFQNSSPCHYWSLLL